MHANVKHEPCYTEWVTHEIVFTATSTRPEKRWKYITACCVWGYHVYPEHWEQLLAKYSCMKTYRQVRYRIKRYRIKERNDFDYWTLTARKVSRVARFSQGDRPSVAGSCLTTPISQSNYLASREKILAVTNNNSFV